MNESNFAVNCLEQMVSTVKLVLKTDAETARALIEMNSFLMHCSAQNRAVLREVLTEHGFHRVTTANDWKDVKTFCDAHKTGVFVLEYPDRLIVVMDGEAQSTTTERPARVWYRTCG